MSINKDSKMSNRDISVQLENTKRRYSSFFLLMVINKAIDYI